MLDAERIKRSNWFKYLGSNVDEDGGVEREINSRVQAGWKNWRDVSGVLCDKKVPLRVKGKLYKNCGKTGNDVWYGMFAYEEHK